MDIDFIMSVRKGWKGWGGGEKDGNRQVVYQSWAIHVVDFTC